jgi:hypothetical protein
MGSSQSETVKTISQQCERLSTGLKPGVNENAFEY